MISLVGFTLQAQNGKVVSTFTNYTTYLNSGGEDKDQLRAAAQNIDDASVHESTKGNPKTWYYKGKVYQLIFEDAVLTAEYAGSILSAADAYMEAVRLTELPDAKKFRYAKETNANLSVTANQLHNYGIELYNAGDAANAFEAFTKAAAVYDFQKERGLQEGVKIPIDDTRFLAGNMAYQLENYDVAKDIYNKLIAQGYKELMVYQILGMIYTAEEDYDNALKILQDGITVFPEEPSLTIDMINIYIITERSTEAIDVMKKAIEQEPTNHLLYF